MSVRSSRFGATQNVASTTTSTASSAFGGFTTQIRVVATAAVNYRIGASPTAVATDALLPANVIEYITVSPGQQLAAIGAATVNITEIS